LVIVEKTSPISYSKYVYLNLQLKLDHSGTHSLATAAQLLIIIIVISYIVTQQQSMG